MEKSLYKFIIRHTKKQQIILLFLTLLSFPFLYATLELPKIIINEAIGGTDFPKDLYFPLFGIDTELWQVEFLLTLSFIFLALVLLNGLFKYTINVYKGRLGEKMLRYLRSKLFHHILHFPMSKFKKIRQGETISIITAEVEPLGGFIGDALALPVFQGGTLLVYIGFIFVQDITLGLAAISLYPVQIYIIPKLQRQVNQLAKKRIQNVRILSTQIGESMSGIKEIYINNTSEYEQNRVDNRLSKIFLIRYDIFKKKFFIKFLNNLMAHLTPFFFFSIGGYLVIQGQLTSGALVAVIAAYKDLSSPWKELLQYYQQKEDVKIKYQQIIEQFNISQETALEKDVIDNKSIDGEMVFDYVTITNDDGKVILDHLCDKINLSKHTCLIGNSSSGVEELSMAISGLISIHSGRIYINNIDFKSFSPTIKGQEISYVDQTPYILSGTIEDNLFYSFMTSPLEESSHNSEPTSYIDYEKAKCSDQNMLNDRVLNILNYVELYEEVFELGLYQFIRDKAHENLKKNIVKARKKLHEKLIKSNLEKLIEPFDENTYNLNASLIENITFGSLRIQNIKIETIAENSWLITVLREVSLYDQLVKIGYEASQILTEIFLSSQNLNSQLVEKFSFVHIGQLQKLKANIIENPEFDIETCSFREQTTLLSIALQLIVSKHRLGLITPKIQEHVIQARQYFVKNIPDHLKSIIDFYHPDRFNEGLNCQNNILYGHLSYNIAHAKNKVDTLLDEVMKETNIKDDILLLGLNADVGTAGAKLTIAQKQKLGLARAMIKMPNLLVCNQALSALDPESKGRIIQNIIQNSRGKGVIWVSHNNSMSDIFDKTIYINNGKKQAPTIQGEAK